MKIQKSQIAVLVLNQSPIIAVFTIVRSAGDPKTALTGDLLYIEMEVPVKMARADLEYRTLHLIFQWQILSRFLQQ